MKKILIIADGILAKHFLERVMNVESDKNEYTIISYRNKTLPQHELPKNFELLSFDPTSLEKISQIKSNNFLQVMIIVTKKLDAQISYKNIRHLNQKIPIILLDRWGLNINDKNLSSLNSKEVLSSRFFDFTPNTPLTAQNVGLGIGEIMEVKIPIGSSYSYKHVRFIEQNKWKIAAIYRNNKLIIPKPSSMLQPNDSLLIVGEPLILQSVYKSIKQELGQFPKPHGSNIYCMIDMKTMDKTRVDKILSDASLLHVGLMSKKLYVKVINPTNSPIFEKIKSYSQNKTDIEVVIEYKRIDANKIYATDIKTHDIGVCLVDLAFFKSNKEMLYKLKTPIFKLGTYSIEHLKDSVIIGNNIEDSEKSSSTVFDVSSQLNLEIKFYDFNPEKVSQTNDLVDHFESTAKLYGKQVDIIQSSDKNPILDLRGRKDILQFVPFNAFSIKSKVSALFSENLDQLHFILQNSHQLFLPTIE